MAPEQQAAEFRSGAAVSSAGESTLQPGDSEVSRGLVPTVVLSLPVSHSEVKENVSLDEPEQFVMCPLRSDFWFFTLLHRLLFFFPPDGSPFDGREG